MIFTPPFSESNCYYELVRSASTVGGTVSSFRSALWALAAAMSIGGGAAHAQEQLRRVLVLYPETSGMPATSIIGDAVRERLAGKLSGNVEIFAEFLDGFRFSGEAHEERFATYLAGKYAQVTFDISIALGPGPLRFLARHRDAVASGRPIVYCCVAPRTLAGIDLPPDASGIVSELDLAKTVELAARLQPHARRIAFVAGATTYERRWEQTARQQLAPYASRYEIRYIVGLPYRQLLDELRRLPRDTIVLFLGVVRDGIGKAYVPRDVVPEIAAASSAPVYSPWDTYLGRGIVGGYMDTFESSGVAVADMVLEIFAGRQPQTLGHRPNSSSAWRVDWRQLGRWDMPAASLPAGTVVLFREPSFWEQHRTVIVAAAGAFALQTAFVVFLLVQMRRRRQAELSFIESEERMAFTAAAVSVGLWQYDAASDSIWATDHCREMFAIGGSTPLTPRLFLQAVHADDRAATRAWMRSVVQSRTPTAREFRVVSGDGEVRWYLGRSRARFDDKGAPIGVSGIFSDITARKNAEMQADAQRQMLTHITRVSTLGELSGAIAHEINQPLAAVMAHAQAARRLLLKRPDAGGEIGDALEDIVRQTGRANEVIKRVRGMLRRGEGAAEPLALNELIGTVLELLNGELVRRQISVARQLAEPLPPVFGDRVQLQQLLVNLLMNAMDAVCAAGASRRAIAVSSHVSGPDQVEITVADDGPGLAPDQQTRIFEPFYTTKEHGLGLGLAICASIVSSHGGMLSIVNGTGGGAVAGVTLPTSAPRIAAVAE